MLGANTSKLSFGPDGERHGRAPPRGRTPLRLVAAGACGFIAGAVFWHMVGFWTFVSEAVLTKHADEVGVQRQAVAGPVKSQSRQGGLAGPVQVTAENCTVAAIDRAGGSTGVATCEGAVRFRPPRGIQRADLFDFGPVPVPTIISGSADGTAVSGWAARVDRRDGEAMP